jgi:tRNA pseudouridine38-40 synthase
MHNPNQRRIRLLISYDGTEFSGWQRQKQDRTIQGEIERCLTVMTRQGISLQGAGRTDRGVHAEGMVAHFDCCSQIKDLGFLTGLNSMLPDAIRIHTAATCDPSFHSRYSATGKRYQYRIFTGKIQPPHSRLYNVHITGILDYIEINECLLILEGTHDFSSFENSGSRDKTQLRGRGAVRTIYRAELRKNSDQLIFEFRGDGFLRNMIRNLMGTILEVGRGKYNAKDFRDILNAKNRSAGGTTAPPHGLFLKEVYYSNSETKSEDFQL